MIEFEFTGEGESHFIPSHSKVFEKFQISLKFQSLNQTNKQSNNYFNIPKFGMLQVGAYNLQDRIKNIDIMVIIRTV